MFDHADQYTWGLIAMVGGVVRYLDVYLKTGQPPSFGPAIATALVSGFSGYMTALFVIHYDPSWAVVAAGVGGYLGTQGLDFVATTFKERFGKIPGGDTKP